MGQEYWRIATRKRSAALSAGWDVGLTPMLKVLALAKAVEFNARYPAYQHKAVSVPGQRVHRRRDPGGTSAEVHPTSPELGRRSWIVL